MPTISKAGWFDDGQDWLPITEEELQMTEPRIDPEAGAEVLLYQLEVDDLGEISVSYRVYERFKVFNERGLVGLNPVQIFNYGVKVKNVKARVIKPDGTIVEVKDVDVLSREIFHYDWLSAHMASFAFPGLESGCIAEFQWTEKVDLLTADNSLYAFALKNPVHKLRFRFRPEIGLGFRYIESYTLEKRLQETDSGYWEVEFDDVPAVPDEPYMGAYFNNRPWLLVYYIKYKSKGREVEEIWQKVCKELHKEQERRFRPKERAVKAKASELVAGAQSQEEALRRIYDFCHRDVSNVLLEEAPEEPEWGGPIIDDPSDVLKHMRGSPGPINGLFASLVRAAGMDATLVACSNRSLLDFDLNVPSSVVFPDEAVCVTLDGERIYLAPGTPFLPFGLLRADNEKAVAVVANREKQEFWLVPQAEASKSQWRRKGIFTLDVEGTLRGTVTEEFTGHRAVETKEGFWGARPDELEDYFLKERRLRMPGATVKSLSVENLSDPDADPVISYTVEVPGYAEVVGGRMFVTCSYFQQGMEPVFINDERKTDIRFPFAWETLDEVWIDFPEGFEIEEGASPPAVLDTDILSYKASMGKVTDQNRVIYKRFERVNILDVPVSAYPSIKAFFDQVHTADKHLLTLRRDN